MIDLYYRPPISTEPISVVLVARDCAAEISSALAQWNSTLNGLNRDYEILVVDDGSSDDTAQTVTELQVDLPSLRLFQHKTPNGFGAALRTGLAAAQHPLVCYCTADRQYEAAGLLDLLSHIDQVDFVTGFRKWQLPPLWYRILETLYRGVMRVVLGIGRDPLPCWLGREGYGRRRLAWLFFGVGLHDPECAFRLLRRELLARIPIQSNGTFAHVEIAAKANFLGALLTETATAYHPPQNGDSAGSFALAKPTWNEFRRVLSKPDFGPVEIETWGHTCLSEELLPPPKEDSKAPETEPSSDEAPGEDPATPAKEPSP